MQGEIETRCPTCGSVMLPQNSDLEFTRLARQWLELKQATVSHGHWQNLNNYINKANMAWGDRNVRSIGYGEIEDLLAAQDLASKSKANFKSVLHDFFTWLRKRRVITHDEFPEFPDIHWQCAWRKSISKETQSQIVDEIKRISWDINPKIHLGVRWLCVYIAVRPAEITRIKEGEIDRSSGLIYFPKPKERRPKVIKLLDEDVAAIQSFIPGMPWMSFFRHTGSQGIKPGVPFGIKYFYRVWKRACKNLDIHDIDLYGGTMHSSTRDLLQWFSPEQVQRASGRTTKSIERYFGLPNQAEISEVFQRASLG